MPHERLGTDEERAARLEVKHINAYAPQAYEVTGGALKSI